MRTSLHINISEYCIDDGKKVKNLKEHIVVDALGLPIMLNVHVTNIYDGTEQWLHKGTASLFIPTTEKDYS